MENELPPDLKNLWQNQSVEHTEMSLTELRQKAERFQKRIRHRNLREYVASVFVFAVFGYFAWRFPGLRFASALILAGGAYVMYQLHTKGSAKTVPESLALGSCLEFHRRELERQRDLLRDVWKWYLLPFVPGLVAFVSALLMQLPPEKWVRTVLLLLPCPAMFYAIWKLNKWAADKLQRQIDDLTGLSE